MAGFILAIVHTLVGVNYSKFSTNVRLYLENYWPTKHVQFRAYYYVDDECCCKQKRLAQEIAGERQSMEMLSDG